MWVRGGDYHFQLEELGMVPEVSICLGLDGKIDVGKVIVFRVWTLECGD